jgi:hypothetical protein
MIRAIEILEKLSLRGKTFTKDLNRAIAQHIKKNPRIILFYQRQQLFRRSIDAKGNPLGFYSPVTEVINKKKKANTPYTMVDSKAFKKGLKIDVKYNKITITSTTPYLNEILDNKVFRDLTLFGLTEDSIRRMMNTHIRPFVRRWINERFTI